MSLTKSEVIEKNRYELQFSVDKATFDAAVSNVYHKQVKNNKKVRARGFVGKYKKSSDKKDANNKKMLNCQ